MIPYAAQFWQAFLITYTLSRRFHGDFMRFTRLIKKREQFICSLAPINIAVIIPQNVYYCKPFIQIFKNFHRFYKLLTLEYGVNAGKYGVSHFFLIRRRNKLLFFGRSGEKTALYEKGRSFRALQNEIISAHCVAARTERIAQHALHGFGFLLSVLAARRVKHLRTRLDRKSVV